MSVIPLTIFFSLLLAGIFVVLFARQQSRRPFSSAERDSLLPLADETPRQEADDHKHDEAEACGCRTGLRAPCAGCLRHAEQPAPTRT